MDMYDTGAIDLGGKGKAWFYNGCVQTTQRRILFSHPEFLLSLFSGRIPHQASDQVDEFRGGEGLSEHCQNHFRTQTPGTTPHQPNPG